MTTQLFVKAVKTLMIYMQASSTCKTTNPLATLNTDPVEALRYSTVQKTTAVFTITPVCTQQGSLAAGLTDIATADYKFNCKAPAKILMKGIYQGKGIATLQTP